VDDEQGVVADRLVTPRRAQRQQDEVGAAQGQPAR
jgi:hypothetical protein